MRGTTIGRRIYHPNNFISNPVFKQAPFLSSSPFSTSSGRGRGRGGFPLAPGQSDFNARAAPEKPESVDSKPESQPSGLGHGRGKPIASKPILGLSTFISSVKNSRPGTGRGQVNIESEPSRPVESHTEPTPPSSRGPEFTQPIQANLPSSISSSVAGVGRGKPIKQEVPRAPAKEENRHVQARAQAQTRPIPSRTEGGAGPSQAQPKLSREEAVKRALSSLSQGGDGEVEGGGERRRFGPGRGSGRGRGRGSGRGRGWMRDGEGRGGRGAQDEEEQFGAGLHSGDNTDGEKLAKNLGVENMSKLNEAFEELSGRVLPLPMEDAYLDAFHTNCMVSVFCLSASFIVLTTFRGRDSKRGKLA